MSELSALKRLFSLAFIICMVNATSMAQDGGADLSGGKDGEKDETFADLPPEKIDDIQRILRRQMEYDAKEQIRQGQELFFSQKYYEAITKFTTAETILTKISSDNAMIVDQIKAVRTYLKQSYVFYARQLVSKGMKQKRVGDFESAKEMIQKAGEYDPSMKPLIRKWLDEIERQKKEVDFEEQTDETKVDPERENREQKVRIFIEQGKVFLKNKQWMRARDLLEKALLIEPGNEEAIRHLRTAYTELRRIAINRRQQQLVMYTAEIDWKWIDPIPAGDRGAAADKKSNPVVKDDNGGIHEKLKKIIIPKIRFEEASIDTVIKFVKERSKQLDFIDGTGVNIVLYKKPSGLKAAVGGDAGATGGDELGEFEEEEGFVEEAPAEAAPAAGATDDGGIPPITLDFDNIPLGEAIRYICTGANLVYRVEEHAVIIAHKDVSPTPFETRFYPIDPNLFQGAAGTGEDDDEGGSTDYVNFFEQKGVDFPVNPKSSEKATVSFDRRTSKLIVRNTPENLRKMERILKELVLRPQQVTIEAKFVEIEQTVLDELSFQWSYLGDGKGGANYIGHGPRETSLGINPDGSGQNSLAGALRFERSTNAPILSIDSVLGAVNFNTLVYWFDQKSNLDLLSAPKVTVLSGAEAFIAMVEERQFPESFEEAEFNNDDGIVSFSPSTPVFAEARTDVGITLTVTPTVQNDEISINLELAPKVVVFKGYEDTWNTTATFGDGFGGTVEIPLRFDTPIFEVRELRTQVTVWDGETVVLGGTIRHDITATHDKIPVLGDLPIFGRLFQSHGEDSRKRNLLIFVTARIIDPSGLPRRSHEIRGLPDFRR